MSYDSVAAHRHMALDPVRNAAYERALRAVVTPETVVLDLGAGLGTLGMLAARLGAKRVFLVEPSDVISVARDVVAENGLTDRVELVHRRVESADLPPVDVITSVMTGNFLLSEDLLPSLFFARDRFLKPGGLLLPSSACMQVVPVCAPELYDEEIACWSMPHEGLHFEAVRRYAANTVYADRRLAPAARFLAAPADLATLDFAAARSAACDDAVEVRCETGGTCHGWLGWFRMRLGTEELSTAPDAPRTHWSPLFLPVDPPLTVSPGAPLSLRVIRPPSGDWSWTTSGPAGTRRHSTFFALPLTADTLRAASPEARPALSVEGRAAGFVLDRLSASSGGVELLASELVSRFHERFSSPDEAKAFVLELVRRFG